MKPQISACFGPMAHNQVDPMQDTEGEDAMRMQETVLLALIVVVSSCVGGYGADESFANKYSVSNVQHHLGLKGLAKLCLQIHGIGAETTRHGLSEKDLRAEIDEKLESSGLTIMSSLLDSQDRFAYDQLLVRVLMAKPEDSEHYAFCIETSVIRRVYLATGSSEPFTATVFRSDPLMEVATVKDMPAAVTARVLRQIEALIEAHRSANPDGVQASGTSKPGQASQRDTEVADRTTPARYEYVASKNSSVFHRADCRWAKNISPGNLVGYSSREEAISDGKRPCKVCKP